MFDSQVHIWARENLPDGNRWEFARRAARSRLPYRDPATIVPRVGQITWDPDASKLIAFMDSAGIEVAVNQVCDFGPCFGEEAGWSIDEIHEHAYRMTQQYPGRILFACGVDPRRHDALRVLERSVKEWGAVAWQCFPANGHAPDDPICYRLYDRCVQLGIPVVIRTGTGDIGPYTAFSHPYLVENVARDFRDLEIIMEHAGGGIDLLWREALMVASTNPNVTLQLGLWQNESDLFGNYGPARMAEFFQILHVMRRKIGAHRILWGTDYMPGANEETHRRWTELFRNLPAFAAEHGYTFSDDETRLMIHDNSARLFGKNG